MSVLGGVWIKEAAADVLGLGGERFVLGGVKIALRDCPALREGESYGGKKGIGKSTSIWKYSFNSTA
jgi:hypothetical protein